MAHVYNQAVPAHIFAYISSDQVSNAPKNTGINPSVNGHGHVLGPKTDTAAFWGSNPFF